MSWVGEGGILEFHAVEEEGGDVVVFEGEDGPVGAVSRGVRVLGCFVGGRERYRRVISWVMVSTQIWRRERGPDSEPMVMGSTSPWRRLAWWNMYLFGVSGRLGKGEGGRGGGGQVRVMVEAEEVAGVDAASVVEEVGKGATSP